MPGDSARVKNSIISYTDALYLYAGERMRESGLFFEMSRQDIMRDDEAAVLDKICGQLRKKGS